MFIIFNTLAQARNYVKRQHDYHFVEGCRCCSHGESASIQGDKVIKTYFDEHMGNYQFNVEVLGRIKKSR